MEPALNWHSLLVVGLGGFLGAALRYLIGFALHDNSRTFPVNTLIVNILGSFFLSLILYYSDYTGLMSESFRNFLTIGLLGAFTTLSAFSYETFKYIELKAYLPLTLYLSLTIIFSLAAIFAGKILAQFIYQAILPLFLQK